MFFQIITTHTTRNYLLVKYGTKNIGFFSKNMC